MRNNYTLKIVIDKTIKKMTYFEIIIFYLRFYKGLRLEEIGKKFNISHEAIRYHLKKITRKFENEI